MKRLYGHILPFAFFMAVFITMGIVVTSCHFHQKQHPLIAVSIQPQKFLLEQIADGKIEVVSLLGDESNPET